MSPSCEEKVEEEMDWFNISSNVDPVPVSCDEERVRLLI